MSEPTPDDSQPSRNGSVPPPPPKEDLNLSVTYNSTLEDNRRCLRHVIWSNRQSHIAVYLVAIAVALFFRVHPIGIVGFFVSLFFVEHLLPRLLLATTLRVRFATPNAVRICTSSLLPRGFHDVTPDSIALLFWKDIKNVTMHEGDLYVMQNDGAGSFVPRTAFEDEEAGRRFYNAARTLWEGALAEQERQRKADSWNETQQDDR